MATLGRETGKKSGWIVRWKVDGKRHTVAYRTKVLAESRRAELIAFSRKSSVVWNPISGLPTELDTREVPAIAECARVLVEEDWEELAQRSRKSLCEALIRFIEASMPKAAPRFEGPERTEVRKSINNWLEAGKVNGEKIPKYVVDWLAEWSPPIDSLNTVTLRRRVSSLVRQFLIQFSELATSFAG